MINYPTNILWLLKISIASQEIYEADTLAWPEAHDCIINAGRPSGNNWKLFLKF